MSNQPKKSNNYIKFQEEKRLPEFTDSLSHILGGKIENKKPDKIIYQLNMEDNNYNDDEYTNKNECLICYETVKKNTSKISCNLCSNICHYKCYKTFIKKSKNYENKCCHCSTQSLKFKIRHWWNCCW